MTDGNVAAVRGFNRFYTGRIGVLGEGHLNSPFSLTEVRVLYELAHREGPAATELARDLGLDPGYLSRILLKFRRRGLVCQEAFGRTTGAKATCCSPKRAASSSLRSNATRARRWPPCWSLFPRGSRSAGRRHAHHRALLGAPAKSGTPYLLRPHQPGDMGWVIHRPRRALRAGIRVGERFEALVAEIAAKFIRNFDARRERCWIAEKDGEIAGSVFLVKKSAKVAKLRLLLVEPAARGLGIGRRLVDECIRFARQAGYRTITLWTQEELHAAQHIYDKAGFRMVREQPHCAFGIPMVGQIWEMAL